MGPVPDGSDHPHDPWVSFRPTAGVWFRTAIKVEKPMISFEYLWLLLERAYLYCEYGVLKFQLAWRRSELKYIDKQIARLEGSATG